MTGRLVLLRHGESVWNAEDRFAGRVDVPLTARGRAQAVAAGIQLQDAGIAPSQVWSSRLRRAYDTAMLAGGAAVREDGRLDERDYGDWQGRRRPDVAKSAPGYRRIHRGWDTRPPVGPGRTNGFTVLPGSGGPETLRDVAVRVAPTLANAVGAVEAGATLLVVAHGNVLRILVSRLEGLSELATESLEIPIAVPRLYSFAPRGLVRAEL